MMLPAHAMVATLGSIMTIAGTEPGLQSLLDRGFEVIAEGRLVGAVECSAESAPITLAEMYHPRKTCFFGEVTYGSFKRLKGDEGGFVCVSFQDWACYQSETRN